MESYYPNGIERLVLIDRLVNDAGLTYGSAQVKISRALRSGLLTSNDGVIQLAQ